MSKYNAQLRNRIYKRDKYCRVCGRQPNNIHHIVYRSYSGSNDPRNLIALCNQCHLQVHKNGKKWLPILISMQEEIYGHLNIEDLKKADKYKNFMYSRK